MKEKILEDVKRKMNKVLEILAQDLARVRTGRASVALLEGIKVEAYDTTVLNTAGETYWPSMVRTRRLSRPSLNNR